MGQAKNRGSFEQRKSQSVAKAEAQRLAEEEANKKAAEEFLKKWNAMTPEEQAEYTEQAKLRKQKMAELNAVLGFAMSSANMLYR